MRSHRPRRRIDRCDRRDAFIPPLRADRVVRGARSDLPAKRAWNVIPANRRADSIKNTRIVMRCRLIIKDTGDEPQRYAIDLVRQGINRFAPDVANIALMVVASVRRRPHVKVHANPPSPTMP